MRRRAGALAFVSQPGGLAGSRSRRNTDGSRRSTPSQRRQPRPESNFGAKQRSLPLWLSASLAVQRNVHNVGTRVRPLSRVRGLCTKDECLNSAEPARVLGLNHLRSRLPPHLGGPIQDPLGSWRPGPEVVREPPVGTERRSHDSMTLDTFGPRAVGALYPRRTIAPGSATEDCVLHHGGPSPRGARIQ